MVRCAVIPRVANCASTCANQICGSEGQKGGSLMETVATCLLYVCWNLGWNVVFATHIATLNSRQWSPIVDCIVITVIGDDEYEY